MNRSGLRRDNPPSGIQSADIFSRRMRLIAGFEYPEARRARSRHAGQPATRTVANSAEHAADGRQQISRS